MWVFRLHPNTKFWLPFESWAFLRQDMPTVAIGRDSSQKGCEGHGSSLLLIPSIWCSGKGCFWACRFHVAVLEKRLGPHHWYNYQFMNTFLININHLSSAFKRKVPNTSFDWCLIQQLKTNCPRLAGFARWSQTGLKDDGLALDTRTCYSKVRSLCVQVPLAITANSHC